MNGSDGRPAAGLWHFAGIGVAMFLAILVAAVAVAKANVVAPRIGDIVTLPPGTEIPRALRFEIAARRKLGAGHDTWAACLLRAETMAQGGGSLVVEEHRPGGRPSYRVHWAGGPTSNGTEDCGRSADLEMSAADLAHVAQLAGGFGVDQGRSSRGTEFASLRLLVN